MGNFAGNVETFQIAGSCCHNIDVELTFTGGASAFLMMSDSDVDALLAGVSVDGDTMTLEMDPSHDADTTVRLILTAQVNVGMRLVELLTAWKAPVTTG